MPVLGADLRPPCRDAWVCKRRSRRGPLVILLGLTGRGPHSSSKIRLSDDARLRASVPPPSPLPITIRVV